MGSQMCRPLRDIRVSTADFLTCFHVSILIHCSLVSFSYLCYSYHASTLYMRTTWHVTCIEQVRFEPPSPIPGFLGNPLFSSLWYIGSAYISSPILLCWIVSYVYFLGSALRVLPFVMLYIYLSRMRKFNKQDLNLSHRIQVGRYLIHRNPVFIRIDKTRCLPCIISIDVIVRFRFFVFLAPSILLNYLEFQSLDNEHQIKYLHVHFSLSSPFHKN